MAGSSVVIRGFGPGMATVHWAMVLWYYGPVYDEIEIRNKCRKQTHCP